MKIKNLRIINFKIHKDIFLDFENENYFNHSTSKNIIIGKNSTGKTSILEAILMFSGSFSFQFSNEKNKNLINFESQNNNSNINSFIEIETDSLSKFKLEITNFRKNYFINNKKIISLKDFDNLPKILSISPNLQYDFLSKEGKRKMFENLISNLDINYIKYKNDYTKLCQKRIKLIQDNNLKLLNIIEKQIVEIGLEMLKIRKNINLESSNKDFSFIKNEPLIDLFLEDIENNQEKFIRFSKEQLEQNRIIDFKTKRMLYSFTRFDFDIFLNKLNYNILSNSQQKQCIYEYIISNIEMISKISTKKLILLIDEIDSFFDAEKINIILNRLDNKNILQIISTSPNCFHASFFKDFFIINI